MSGTQIVGGKELLAALDRASVQSPEEVHKVVQRGSFNVKRTWRQLWSGHAHIPALPYAVTYDTQLRGDQATGEIGVDQSKPQGPLAGIIAWGEGGNAPLPGPLPALEEEEPRFAQALLNLGAELLEKP